MTIHYRLAMQMRAHAAVRVSLQRLTTPHRAEGIGGLVSWCEAQLPYRAVMRWQPQEPACAECGFDWGVSRHSAIDLVAAGPDAAARALAGVMDPMHQAGARWSASMYVWHLVDVLRIGTERLLTLTHDPASGIPCWDENALARDRHYHRLSPVVGLIALRSAACEWVTVALAAPAIAQVRHPQFGTLGDVEVIRRNAHEVHHHLWDIHRQHPGPDHQANQHA